MDSHSQVTFIDGQFRLIHIPLNLYASLLQPILRIILPSNVEESSLEGSSSGSQQGSHLHEKHGFLNVSITPIECSIICHEAWAIHVFEPAFAALPPEAQTQVSISTDNYLVFSVSSLGMEAGSRVMELTAPLAMAGIPIFFITTYYTDFILVPSLRQKTVVEILLTQGFEFSDEFEAFIIPTLPTPQHERPPFSEEEEYPHPPSTPPPTNVAELQIRTFKQLRKQGVLPFVVPGLQLVQCSAKDLSDSGYGRFSHHGIAPEKEPHWLDNVDTKLYLALISTLSLASPKFFSLTIAKDYPPTILLDKSYLPIFGDSLAGDTSGFLIPIFLDLSNLPLKSTGIVCGVAGTLVEDSACQKSLGSTLSISELSYLSTARAGAVILSEAGCDRALEVLAPLLLPLEKE